MIRRLARWAGRAALGIAILAVLLVVVLHTPPGKTLLRNFVLAVLQGGGLDARLDRIEVEPLGLEARLFGLELARPGHPPFLRAKRIVARFDAAALRGRFSLDELLAEGVSLDLVRNAQGDWNVPQAASSDPKSFVDLRPFLRARIAITDVDLSVRAGDAFELLARGLALEWSRSERKGTLTSRDEIQWQTKGRQGRLSLSPVEVAADEETLTLVSPRLAGAEGEAALTAKLGLSGANAPVAVDAEGRFHLNELFVGEGAPPVQGHVSWTARGKGTLQAITLDADLRTDALALGAFHAETRATVSVADDRVTLLAQIEQGTLPLGSLLSGTLKAQWPLAEPERMEASVDARIEPSSAPGSPDARWRGQTELRISSGRYVLTLDHRIGEAARLAGRAEGGADLAQPLANALRGSLHLDVAQPATIASLLAGDDSPSDLRSRWTSVRGQLLGDFTLEGTVGEPVAKGRLSGAGLTSRGLPPLDADAVLRVSRRQADVESVEVRGGGGATLQAEASVPFDGRPLSGRARGRVPDLSAWATLLSAPWAPSGSLGFEVSLGGTLARPEGSATLEGQEVNLLAQPRLERVRARLRGSAEAVLLESLSLEQTGGRIDAAGHFDLVSHDFAVQASAYGFAFEPAPAGALTEEALPLRGRLQGKTDIGASRGEVEGGGRFELRDLSWDGRPLGAATVEIAREETRPHGFTAALRLDGADLRALTRAAGLDDEAFSGTAGVAVLYHGDVTGRAAGSWDLDLDRLEGTAFALPARLRDPAHGFAGEGRASLKGLDLDLAGGRLSGAGTLDSSGDGEIQVRWRGPLQGLSPLLSTMAREGETAPDLVGSGELVASLKGTPERPRLQATLKVEGGGLNQGDEPLVQSMDLAASFREGTLRVEALEAVARGFHVTLTGEAGAGLLPSSLPAPVRRSLGGEARARAHLSIGREPGEHQSEPLRVEADLETDGRGLDRVRGKAEVTGLAFEVQDMALRPDRNFTMELASGLLTIPTVDWQGGDNDLRFGGTVRLPGEGQPFSNAGLDLQASGAIDLRLLAGLGRGVEAGGLARVDAHIRGSVAVPNVEGSLDLDAGVLRYRPWRIALDDLTYHLKATADRLVVEALTGTLNGGALEGKGELQLAGGKPRGGQVALTLAGAALDWPKGFRGSLDGGLEIRGGGEGPTLLGKLTLANAAYDGDPRTLVPVARPALRSSSSAAGETPSLLAGLALDVRFLTENEVRVATPFGAFPFSLDLRATGTADEPRLRGAVSLGRDGYIYWSGRRFDIERGSLTWSPSAGLVPFVEARATTRVSTYSVNAAFTGPLTSAEASLSSNPPLSENEIASLLTTGNTSSGGRDSRAIGIVSANFLGNLGKVAGLDSVRIENADETSLLNFDPSKVASETNPAQRLTITKRLSDTLEATVSLNLTESGKTTTFVGWKPFPAVEVRVTQRDDYTGALELRHDVTFGGGGHEKPRRPKVEKGRSGGREIVRSLEIQDEGGGPKRRLQGKLKLRPGKTFNYEDWQKDRERIEAAVARRGYSETYVIARREPRATQPEGGEVDLTYLVRRGSHTLVEFRGGLEAPDSLRSEIASAWTSGDFESSIEDEALQKVRVYLAHSGFFAPHLSAKVETSRDGKTRTLVISGEPGLHARRRRVAFTGSRLVPTLKLQALVKGQALEDQAWGDPARLEAAVAVLYRDEGFLAAAAHARPPVVDGNEAVLTVDVDEGPLFHIGPIVPSGCVQVECTEAALALGLKEGAVYREADIAAARGRVVSLYRKRGFNAVQARLAGDIRTKTAQVDLHLQIEEGAQQVVREVVVSGADDATRRALDRVVTISPGQPVVLEDWAAIRKRLYGTGLVRGVTLEPEVLPREDATEAASDAAAVEPVRASVEYDMWPALRLRYGLQLVTEKPLNEGGNNAVDLGATAELTRAVFLGRAVSTALSGEVRPDIWNVRGVLSVPRTFGRALRSSLYLIREHERTEFDLPQLGTTVPALSDNWEVILEERWRRGKLETALSYDIQWLTLGFPDTTFTDIPFRPARLVGTVLMDGRNNILDPRKGYFSSLSGDYGAKALGSEFNFSRIFTQQYAYIPVPGGLVAASGIRFERASGDGQSFLSTERLSFGGPTTVRGYDRDRVDLLNLFGAVGATTDVLVLNQEVRFPIWAELRGVAFLDFGRIAARIEGVSGSDTRLGTGLGLRYSTPVGVLRLDLGFPLRGPEKKGMLYFGLGQAF